MKLVILIYQVEMWEKLKINSWLMKNKNVENNFTVWKSKSDEKVAEKS